MKTRLLRGGSVIDHTGQTRFATGRIVLVNNAFLGGLVKALDGDLKPFLRSFDVTGFHGRVHAFGAFANAALDLTIALAAHETLTMSFQC